MPLVCLYIIGRKAKLGKKFTKNIKSLPDRIEPVLLLILLHHSTPTLPVPTNKYDIFKNTSQFTEYLQYFSEIYYKFASMS
jgi:hypothetical protein